MRFGCVCLFLGRFDPFPWQLLLFWAPSRLLDVFITFVASLRQSIFNKRPSHFGDTHSKALALCYARFLESFRLKPTILLHCTVYAVLWRWSLLLWWSFVFRPAKIGRYSNLSANQIWVKKEADNCPSNNVFRLFVSLIATHELQCCCCISHSTSASHGQINSIIKRGEKLYPQNIFLTITLVQNFVAYWSWLMAVADNHRSITL